MKQRMKRKTLRLYLLAASLCLLGVAVGLTLYAFQSRIVYFFSPSDIAADRPATGRTVRLGGLVEAGSVTSERVVGDRVPCSVQLALGGC